MRIISVLDLGVIAEEKTRVCSYDAHRDNEMTSVEYSYVYKNDVAFTLIFTISYLDVWKYGVITSIYL